MNPKIIKRIIQSDTLDHFSALYGLRASELKQLKLHDGAANLFYRVRGKRPAFLRISYRLDRDQAMIETELDFLAYLAAHGFHSPAPIRSLEGKNCETYNIDELSLTAVLFSEIRGIHLYERAFRLPEGISLNQFWQSCGKALGRLHALSQKYLSEHKAKRFNWLDRHEQSLPWLFPDSPESQALLCEAINELRQIPRTNGSFGISHNDFNIGNLLIDYEAEEFEPTIIDFDDSGFNYYMYDLACFWEMSTGWAINLAQPHEWPEYMHRTYSTMLEEYHKQFNPDFNALDQLPLFLKAVHLENILEPLRELHYAEKALIPDQTVQYHLLCLKQKSEYAGLYDKSFDPQIWMA